jgi:hypothetical protein
MVPSIILSKFIETDLIQFKAWTPLCILLLQLICSERKLGQTPILSKTDTDPDFLETPL